MADISPLPSLAEHISDSLFELLIQSSQPDNRAQLLVMLKARADFYWGKDPRTSLMLAELMMSVGRLYSDLEYQALGKMAYGDALLFLNRIVEAHQSLQEAGDQFLNIGNEVGWARTRIGRLITSQNFGSEQIAQALADLGQAREIFVLHKRFDLLVRVCINLASFHELRSEFAEARSILQLGISSIGDEVNEFRAKLMHNFGILEQVEGNFRDAKAHYDDAERWFRELNQPFDVAHVGLSQSSLLMMQGSYRSALHLMQAIDRQLAFNEWVRNQLNMLVCFQLLGANERARLVATRLVEKQGELRILDAALAYMYLGETEAEFANFPAALAALNTAAALFEKADAYQTLLEVYMRRAYIQLNIGDLQAAHADAMLAAQSTDMYVSARSSLILGQLALRQGQFIDARAYAVAAFAESRRVGIAALRFGVSLLLGNIREQQASYEKALTHYQQANKLVMHIQRDLTLDFRPGFLESSQAALHAAIRVLLHDGKMGQALQTLEAMKSQVIFQHLVKRMERKSSDSVSSDNNARDEFLALRERYLWMIDQEAQGKLTSAETFYAEKRDLERDMLELRASIRLDETATSAYLPSVDIHAIQQALEEDSGLLEFYCDGHAIYAITLRRDSHIEVYPLDVTYEEVNQLVTALRRILRRALAAGADKAHELYHQGTQDVLRKIYEVLLYPLSTFIAQCRTIIIAPYGILHMIPFQLLYNGISHLFEYTQVVIQPASGLLTQKINPRPPGAFALAYSGGSDAYRMEQEARRVVELFGGQDYAGQDATRQRLNVKPAQILHIAAHGKYHLNQPRLSHIRLADGLFYADDLEQFDLAYELVTLSACSVGQGHPSGGDELIGLGHSFLYSGAGAVVSSLWEVDDAASEAFTEQFYTLLKSGSSKAEAMQAAQLSLMNDARFQHPAYWGAFQLLGNSEPLSGYSRSSNIFTQSQ